MNDTIVNIITLIAFGGSCFFIGRIVEQASFLRDFVPIFDAQHDIIEILMNTENMSPEQQKRQLENLRDTIAKLVADK